MNPQAKNITEKKGLGNLETTTKYILQVYNESLDKFKEYSKTFQASNLKDTSLAIWQYLRNLNYKRDDKGIEQIRRPERTINDNTGDCEDFAILTNVILTNLGYKPFFFIVAFSGDYQHIYSGVKDTDGNIIVIDGVYYRFNKHPENISKFFILYPDGKKKYYNTNPENMQIDILSGIEKQNCCPLVNEIFKAIQPGITGIGEDEILRVNKHARYDMEKLINDYYEFINNGEINGIKDEMKKIKEKIDETGKKIKVKVDATTDNIKEAVRSGKVTDFTKTVALAPARAPFLILLSLNVFHMASKLYLGYITPETANKLGIKPEDHKQIIDIKDKFEKFWNAVGGDVEKLRKIVKEGKGKKYIEKQEAKKQLGDPVTGSTILAAISSSSVIWSPLLIWFGKIKNAFDGVLNSKTGQFITQNFDKIKETAEKVKDFISPKDKDKDKDKIKKDVDEPKPDTDEKNNSWIWWGLGGLGLTLLLFKN